jgi:hypothetical protein
MCLLRKCLPALQATAPARLEEGRHGLLAFRRGHDEDLKVIINFSEDRRDLLVNAESLDLLSGQRVRSGRVSIGPRSTMWLQPV